MIKYLSRVPREKLRGKTCLLRVDLNVEKGDEKSALRMKTVVPTVDFLTKNGVKVVILSHRGRPKGFVRSLSLKNFAAILSRFLKRDVKFIGHFNFFEIKRLIKNSPPKSVFLLENLRFLPSEEKNSGILAKKIASLGDFYVNDAFAVSHRKNASVAAVADYLPSYGGFLLEKEIKSLSRAGKAKGSLVVVLGGAKIADKIDESKKLVKKAKLVLLGSSAVDLLPAGVKKKLSKNKKLVFPADTVKFKSRSYDIGPQTIEKYAAAARNAGVVVWNGPVGYFENPRFAAGSKRIAEAIFESGASVFIGGGETVAVLQGAKIGRRKSKLFLSTGGGAMLLFLSGEPLAGLKALEKNRWKLKT